MIEKIASSVISNKYSRGSLPIYGSKVSKYCKNAVSMLACLTGKKRVRVPLSKFSMTGNSEVILYRGVSGISDKLDLKATKSAAAADGWSIKSIFNFFRLKRNIANIKKMATASSSQTSFNDAFIHTTTKKNWAKKYAPGGYLLEYHIPIDYLKKHGILGCYDYENEVNFLHSIPDKFLAKTRKIQGKENIKPGNLSFFDAKFCYLPKFSDRTYFEPTAFMTRGLNPYFNP